MGLTPGSGRSPGEGHGNPLQYFFLENPMDRKAWRGKTSLRDAPCGSITNTEKKGFSENMKIKIKVNVVTMTFNNGSIEMVSMSLFI